MCLIAHQSGRGWQRNANPVVDDTPFLFRRPQPSRAFTISTVFTSVKVLSAVLVLLMTQPTCRPNSAIFLFSCAVPSWLCAILAATG